MSRCCSGIQFPQNFNNPYRSLTMQDFWRRWHMTLSRWLRDYLYVGLGGNRRGERRTYVNLFLVMIIGGLWHGANTTFIIWGALHGTALVVERYFIGRWPLHLGPAGVVFRWLATFNVVCLGWIFFNARSTSVAFDMIGQILGIFRGDFGLPAEFVSVGVLVVIGRRARLAVRARGRAAPRLVALFSTLPAVSQGIILGMVMVVCYRFGSIDEFIYFQF